MHFLVMGMGMGMGNKYFLQCMFEKVKGTTLLI